MQRSHALIPLFLSKQYFTCSAAVFLMVTQTPIPMIFYTIIIFASSIVGLTVFTCQTKFKYSIYTGVYILAGNRFPKKTF